MNGSLFPSLRAIGSLGAAVGLTNLAAATRDQPDGTGFDRAVAHRTAAVPMASGPRQKSASLYFTAPVQGDHFRQGDSTTVRWDRVGDIGQKCFQLFLFQNSSQVRVLTKPDARSYFQWTVPNSLSGSGYKFRVRTCNAKFQADSPSFPIISTRPDLVVARHSLTPLNAAIPGGDMHVRFRARIDNIGSGSAGPSQARLEMKPSQPGAQANETFDVPALAFGGHHNITKDLVLYTSGAWTYRFEADWGDHVQEAGESSPSGPVVLETHDAGSSQAGQDLGNNLATGSYTVASLADLEMASLYKYPEHAQFINRSVKITGHVVNRGTAPAQNVKLEISCSRCNMGLASGSASITRSKTLPSLQAGSDSWVDFNLSWPCKGQMTCRVRADPDNTVQEFREGNNQKLINVRIKVL
jgi:hypothetical protein